LEGNTEGGAAIDHKATLRWPVHLRLLAAAIALGGGTGLLTFIALAPPVVPRVINTTQITHSGRVDPWPRLVGDGSRLYFLEREGDHWNLVQTSLAGGESQIVPVPFRNTVLLSISPNHSEFLMASFTHVGEEMPLWTWPVQGGSPMRVGDLTAFDAAWHPNGRQIIYAHSDGIYLADKDGSQIVKVAAKGRACCFAWSPDGNTIRFSVFPSGVHGSSLWEIRSDGTNLHPLLPDWSNPPVDCCGAWSLDGEYFFFGSAHSGSYDLWGLQEKSGVLRRRQSKPFQLTTGPVSFGGLPLVSVDKQKLYVFGTSYQTDLVNYDSRSRQFTAFLPRTRAMESDYSRDGEWLVYVTAPDNMIWRAKPDGSQRTPITANPTIVATHAVWSHDAKQIAFVNHVSSCENKIFVVSAEGGIARELFPGDCEQFDPAWSPDGKYLAFARAERLASGTSAPSTIELLDLTTNFRSTLTGSKGLRAPSWSPDGRLVAAISEDYRRLVLFDVATQSWTELAQGSSIAGFLKWSKDGASLYYQDLLAPNEAVYRIRTKDHRREEIVNFGSLIREGASRCAFIDLAPNGSLVVSVLRNHADIYALDLDRP
jgi:Tol biopolymer transport system component